ncbi:putative protein YjbI with pentapeptide repeats OS=Streptomyces griseomycini OX=66895 GN=FHS37_001652 PE=4 SV=1 [Streptomyces griseomycini]
MDPVPPYGGDCSLTRAFPPYVAIRLTLAADHRNDRRMVLPLRRPPTPQGRYTPRLWSVWLVAPLALLVVGTLSFLIYHLAYDFLTYSANRQQPRKPVDVQDVIKTTVTVLTLIGAVLTGIYAYRKQLLAEGDAHRADASQLADRYTTAAEQLGHDQAAVRLAGVYALAHLADDWVEQRQVCIDVLCAYLRMPYQPDPTQPGHREGEREVRHAMIRVIRDHLRDPWAPNSWCSYHFDFTEATFDGGDFSGSHFRGKTTFLRSSFTSGTINFGRSRFSEGNASFVGADFQGGTVHFDEAEFSGGKVNFHGARFRGSAVRFTRAVFNGSTVNLNQAEFSQGNVTFADATFGSGTVDFTQADFNGGRIIFTDSTFNGATVSLTDAEFSDGTADFTRAEFNGGSVSLGNSVFSGGTVALTDAQFKDGTVSFTGAAFRDGTIDFTGSGFSGGSVDFIRTEFCGSAVSFTNVEFSDGITKFINARFQSGTVEFTGAGFSGGRSDFTGAKFYGSVVDFSGARLNGGAVIFTRTDFRSGRVNFEQARILDSSSIPQFNHATFGGTDITWGRVPRPPGS